jgi:hypothetical protein
MIKQTHMLALMAAVLFAVTALTSGGRLQAAQDLPAPHINIASLILAAAPVSAAGIEVTDEILPMKREIATSEDSSDERALLNQERAVPFMATTGLDKFSAYRMDYTVSFDGTRDRQPTSGIAEGTLEATNSPDAQHLQATLAGEAFRQLGVLGTTMEMYRVNDTIYYQDPQDGAWTGVPERLVDRFLPDGMPAPEDYVVLPNSAERQLGRQIVNGEVTQRYTFDRDDLGNARDYDDVEGTIWVADDGDYIVRYEATLSGRHENLAAGGVELMDEGTISIVYELSDVNDSLNIEAPKGARRLSLRSMLSLLGSLR